MRLAATVSVALIALSTAALAQIAEPPRAGGGGDAKGVNTRLVPTSVARPDIASETTGRVASDAHASISNRRR